MKPVSHARALAISAAFVMLFSAPAFSQDAQHDHEHNDAAPKAATPKTKPAATKKAASKDTAASGQMGMMDMKAMCDMHKQMMGKSDADRQAMMDEKMPGMSADKKQRQMHMMDEQCK